VRPAKPRRTSFTPAAIVVVTTIDACAETPPGDAKRGAPLFRAGAAYHSLASDQDLIAHLRGINGYKLSLRRCRIRRTLTYRCDSLRLAVVTISRDIECLRANLAFERIIAS